MELHLRNRHRGRYDFNALVKNCPDLAPFVGLNPFGNESINFANPQAVKMLNKAILKLYYHIEWDLPENYLCPPIPGRADYIHYIADLISEGGVIPRNIAVLDIGVGANCIYPLIGHSEYGWKFVGTDIDPEAISIANGIIARNGLVDAVEIRLQKSPLNIFKGVLSEKDVFAVSLCNPPFHNSLEEAQAGTARKWKNLKIKTKELNFGGQSNELSCIGGEVAFIKRMIEESPQVPCKWFTTLVSKESSLPRIYKALEKVRPSEVRTIPMAQGQKKSRIVAWNFGFSFKKTI